MPELHALIIEDSESDALLLLRELERGGYTPIYQRVDGAEAMRQALREKSWEIVFSDHNMPGFNSFGALEVLKESGLDIPFIIVSALIGEETAVQAMKAGAHDYLMKDRLARLIPTVEREIREAKSRAVKRQAEEALKLSEAKFRFMADNAPVIIWMTDENHALTYVNRPFLDCTGYKPGCGNNFEWVDKLHPEDQVATKNALFETTLHQAPFTLEYRLLDKNGEYRWMINHGTPLFESNGRFKGYIGSILDITDRKMAERALEIYTRKLEHSNRELEQFALVASHDLQAPLRKVNIFADFLRNALGESANEEALDYIARIQKSTRRMQQLVGDLLSLSRVNRNDGHFSRVNIQHLVKTVLDDLEEDIANKNACIEVDAHIELEADATQLKQLLQNLFENSLKFYRPEVRPEISVCARTLDNERCEIVVRDNGIGIREEYREKIFQVFQRLHEESLYPGNGIGLAIVKKIVERHSGHIALESEVGEGTTFTIILPLSQTNYISTLSRLGGGRNTYS